jgi:hypothetical protein
MTTEQLKTQVTRNLTSTLFRKLRTVLNLIIDFIVEKTAASSYGEIAFKPTQETISTTSGALVVGKKYLILALEVGDVFTNVGYVEPNTIFTATGTTPTTWTEGTVVINVTDSAPVLGQVINNIGTITTSYVAPGKTRLHSAALFTENLTFFPTQIGLLDEDATKTFKLTWISSSIIEIETFTEGVLTDELLDGQHLRIKVFID